MAGPEDSGFPKGYGSDLDKADLNAGLDPAAREALLGANDMGFGDPTTHTASGDTIDQLRALEELGILDQQQQSGNGSSGTSGSRATGPIG